MITRTLEPVRAYLVAGDVAVQLRCQREDLSQFLPWVEQYFGPDHSVTLDIREHLRSSADWQWDLSVGDMPTAITFTDLFNGARTPRAAAVCSEWVQRQLLSEILAYGRG